MNKMHTCRFCKQLCGDSPEDEVLRYGVRHYAHIKCLRKAYTDDAMQHLLNTTPLWQVKQIPYLLALELDLIPMLEKTLGHHPLQ